MRRRRSVRGRSANVALVLAFLFSANFPSASFGNDLSVKRVDDPFCGPRLARDFLRPLESMPDIRRVPAGGTLPFGPQGLRLERRGGRLVVNGGLVGFGFRDRAVGQVRRLNWIVAVSVIKVTPSGRVVGNARSKVRNVGSIEGNRIGDVLVPLPASPAFYRLDISFRSARTMRLLGTFSDYVRTVQPHFDSKILLSPSTAHAGEMLSVRLANFGTETLSSFSPDWRLTLERFDGATWSPAPSDPPPEKAKPIVQKLAAGHMDDCIRIPLSPNEVPGLYRVSMMVERSQVGGAGRDVRLTAEFGIPVPRVLEARNGAISE